MTYYSTAKINKKKATYNVIFGERSNGKTYALLKQSVKSYFEDGSQMGYIRRWKEDIVGRRAQQLFAGLNENGEIKKISKGAYDGVHYHAGKFYLCTYDDNGKANYSDVDIVAYSFALSDGEHDKSTSYPKIKTIVFDEFLTNKVYLVDEFVHFMNSISTIVRKRDDVVIYMLGNTVNKFCPYFNEMGLDNVAKMEQGTIDVYHYGNSSLTVAVEYCASTASTKTNNKYFAFNNPKLEMITGGAWELSIYPHLPKKYSFKHILFTYYIIFSDNIFQCEVIDVDGNPFTYIHAKTTPIKDEEEALIYSLEPNHKINYNRSVYKPLNYIQKRVLWFFVNDRVFYQNNSIGDAINNYLKICKRI